MNTDEFAFLRDRYSWQALNRSLGERHTRGRSSDAVYRTPIGEIRGYDYEPSFEEALNPFVPTSSLIFEIPIDGWRGDMYLVGDGEVVESLEKDMEDLPGDSCYTKIIG